MLRRSLIVMLAVASWLPAAQAADSKFEAVLAPPKATLEPDTAPSPLDCPPDICGLQLPDELWKRDALKKQPETYLNADAVVIDRSRREALDKRFTETPPLETRLGNSSCFASLMIVKDFEGKPIINFLRCGS